MCFSTSDGLALWSCGGMSTSSRCRPSVMLQRNTGARAAPDWERPDSRSRSSRRSSSRVSTAMIGVRERSRSSRSRRRFTDGLTGPAAGKLLGGERVERLACHPGGELAEALDGDLLAVLGNLAQHVVEIGAAAAQSANLRMRACEHGHGARRAAAARAPGAQLVGLGSPLREVLERELVASLADGAGAAQHLQAVVLGEPLDDPVGPAPGAHAKPDVHDLVQE